MTVTADVRTDRTATVPPPPTGVGPTGASLPPSRRSAASADRQTHLLRLSLDLQLDAMLLVLGASAAGRPEDAMPWRRWLEEDVDLAWELTTTALAARGGLPPSLGPDLATADPSRLTEDLLARYASMCSLLEDLLARDAAAPIDVTDAALESASGPVGLDPASPVWHEHVRDALRRYQARVAELEAHRSALARGAREETAEQASAGHAYLPGELLG